jgi:hypothetical protein
MEACKAIVLRNLNTSLCPRRCCSSYGIDFAIVPLLEAIDVESLAGSAGAE